MRRRPGYLAAFCKCIYTPRASCLTQLGSFSALGGSVLSRYFRVHCPNCSGTPARPRRPDKRPATPNITAERVVWWSRSPGTHLECPHRRPQSSVHPFRQFVHHALRGLHRSVG